MEQNAPARRFAGAKSLTLEGGCAGANRSIPGGGCPARTGGYSPLRSGGMTLRACRACLSRRPVGDAFPPAAGQGGEAEARGGEEGERGRLGDVLSGAAESIESLTGPSAHRRSRPLRGRESLSRPDSEIPPRSLSATRAAGVPIPKAVP